jgi:hypothetical protein
VAGEFVRKIAVQLQKKAEETVADLAFGQSSRRDSGIVEP